jgi:hypothetical protein
MRISIANVKYGEKDLEVRREAMLALHRLGEKEVVIWAAMFADGDRSWSFAAEAMWYKAIAALANNHGNVVNLPPDVQVAYKPVSQQIPAGSMKIGKELFASVDNLIASPIMATFNAMRPVLLNEMRFPQLVSLLADPFEWSFDDWAHVNKVLADWNGVPPYPTTLRACRQERRPGSKLETRFDRTRNVDVPAWNPAMVVNSDNWKTCKQAFEYAWGACGNTAEFLISRVHDLQGDVRLEDEFTVAGKEGAQRLLELLCSPVEGMTLVNVGNELIHEFVIEKHAGDGVPAILQQGYLLSYYATWWAGLDDSMISLKDLPLAKMKKARTENGAGTVVNLKALGVQLGEFMAAPLINSGEAAIAWSHLPFRPDDRPNKAVAPSFVVRVWSVNAPQTAFQAISQRLPGADKIWLTQAVLQEAQDFWERIKSVRPSTTQDDINV